MKAASPSDMCSLVQRYATAGLITTQPDPATSAAAHYRACQRRWGANRRARNKARGLRSDGRPLTRPSMSRPRIYETARCCGTPHWRWRWHDHAYLPTPSCNHCGKPLWPE